MKVLHLIKTADGATWAFRQIRVLREAGVIVAVCLPEGQMAEKYRADGVEVFPMQFSLQPLQLRACLQNLRSAIKGFKPDAVHSHFFITTMLARLSRKQAGWKSPIIFQVPGPLHLEHRLFKRFDLGTASASDYYIGSSRWTVDKYRASGVPEKRVFLSYYGSDLQFVKPHPKGKLRNELGFAKDDYVVAMVAYMYKPKAYLGQKGGIKGHEDFFVAAADCLKRIPNMRVVVIGGAWNNAHKYEQRLVQLGRSLCGDRITFLGSRNDVPELYADIDLAVHPSHSENLGGAVESLLLEVPTIASNVGGLPDAVSDGITGLLTPPRRPDRLAECIMHAYGQQEKVRAFARVGRSQMLELLDVTRTGKEVADIYRQILSKSRTPNVSFAKTRV